MMRPKHPYDSTHFAIERVKLLHTVSIWSRTHVLLASFFWAQYFAADHVPTPHSTEKLTDVKIYTVSLLQPPKWLGLQVNPTG